MHEPHSLIEHLLSTSTQAAEFAETWGKEWSRLAGRWHDLAKYSEAFQSYLERAGNDGAHAADAVPHGRVDHSTAGALHAVERLNAAGRLLAYAIAGHHAGLPDWHGGLEERLRCKTDLLAAVRAANPPEAVLAGVRPPAPARDSDLSLFVRMVFSALIDADRLDTEAFTDPERAARRRTAPSVAELSVKLDERLSTLAHGAAGRQQVLGQAQAGQALAPVGLAAGVVGFHHPAQRRADAGGDRGGEAGLARARWAVE